MPKIRAEKKSRVHKEVVKQGKMRVDIQAYGIFNVIKYICLLGSNHLI